MHSGLLEGVRSEYQTEKATRKANNGMKQVAWQCKEIALSIYFIKINELMTAFWTW
jgi:hypothetical protein